MSRPLPLPVRLDTVPLNQRATQDRAAGLPPETGGQARTLPALQQTYFFGVVLAGRSWANSKSMYCSMAWGSAVEILRPLTKMVGVLRTSSN